MAPLADDAATNPPAARGLPAGTPRFAEKRAQILHSAARLFNTRGIKAGTLAELAERLGLATNSLTYYYRRKEDLVVACLMQAIDEMRRLVAEADGQADHDARVAGFLHRFVALMSRIARGEQAELIYFSDMRALPQPQAEPVFAAYTDLFRGVRRLLRDGPPLPAGQERLAHNARAHLLLSLTGWSRAWLGRYDPADHGHAAHWLTDTVLHGLAAPGQPWPDGAPARLQPPAAADPTRDAYLRTATRLVNAQGVGGTSVERIAADLALTKGSFYHHHSTKDDLIAACFERTFAVIRQAQALAAAQGGSGWQRLLGAVLPLARFQLSADGPLLRATSWTALPGELRSDQFSTMNRLGERFGTFIVGGMADGSIRVLDPGVAAQQINGMINGLAEIEHWVPGVTPDNVVALYARPLLLGLSHAAPA